MFLAYLRFLFGLSSVSVSGHCYFEVTSFFFIFQEADIGIGGFALTNVRLRVVDYLQPLWEDSVTYLMSVHPKSNFESSFKPLTVTNSPLKYYEENVNAIWTYIIQINFNSINSAQHRHLPNCYPSKMTLSATRWN